MKKTVKILRSLWKRESTIQPMKTRKVGEHRPFEEFANEMYQNRLKMKYESVAQL